MVVIQARVLEEGGLEEGRGPLSQRQTCLQEWLPILVPCLVSFRHNTEAIESCLSQSGIPLGPYFCKLQVAFMYISLRRFLSGHSTIKQRSVECCSDGFPSWSVSHLHTGSPELSQSEHKVFGHLSYPKTLLVQLLSLVQWLSLILNPVSELCRQFLQPHSLIFALIYTVSAYNHSTSEPPKLKARPKAFKVSIHTFKHTTQHTKTRFHLLTHYSNRLCDKRGLVQVGEPYFPFLLYSTLQNTLLVFFLFLHYTWELK